MGGRPSHEDADPERLPSANRGGVVDSDPSMDLVVKSDLVSPVAVSRELNPIHAEVRLHDAAAVGMFRIDLGKGDERTPVVGPALDPGNVLDGTPVAKHGSRGDGLRKRTESGPWSEDEAPRAPPGVRGIGFDPDYPFHRFEGIAEEKAGTLESSEEIRDRLESGLLHLL